MVSRTQIPFYDEDNGVFRTNDPDLKLAVHLGEDVDNPLVSFRHEKSNQKNEMDNFTNEIKDNFDNIENELYYKLKDMAGSFFKETEKLNSENLLLQKYLTSLTKEKMDLLVQINLCMTRLDEIEKYLGINIANKRNKKSLINQKK